MTLWPNIHNWKVTLIGKGRYLFHFNLVEDMRKIWTHGMVNLKPGLLRLYSWSKGFDPLHQVQSHAQIWVRLVHLPQEYWQHKTLFETTSGLGVTPRFPGIKIS